MPTRTYMVVDPRRDHRFGIPDRSLSDALGTPYACDGCHARKSIEATNSAPPAEHFGTAFWLSRHQQLAGKQALQKLLESSRSEIVKATALMELGTYADDDTLNELERRLGDADDLQRYGAVRGLESVPLARRTPILLRHLQQPALSVRLAMAPLLAGVDRQALDSDQRKKVEALWQDYRNWLSQNGDRAEAQVALAGLLQTEGDVLGARQHYETALLRDSTSLVALLNYADYYRALGDEDQCEVLLRKAVALYPDSADAQFALGLLEVRRGHLELALTRLDRARTLAPDNSHYIYVYAVGLYTRGQSLQAVTTLADARARFPANAQIRDTLKAYCRESGDTSVTASCPR